MFEMRPQITTLKRFLALFLCCQQARTVTLQPLQQKVNDWRNNQRLSNVTSSKPELKLQSHPTQETIQDSITR